MTTQAIGQLLGVFAFPVALLYFVGMGIFTLLFPWLWISALRNVKKIRHELERLNEILEQKLSADVSSLPRR